jgi:DNA-directed RNA polymerase subunit RPC12/RpoP
MANGMKIDDSTNEGKLALALLDVLKDVADELDMIDEKIEEMDEELDEMAEIIGDLEEQVEELEAEIYGDLDDMGLDGLGFGDDLYEITCSECDNTVSVDMSMLDDGSINCPNCGEKIEFNIDFLGDCDCCGDDD